MFAAIYDIDAAPATLRQVLEEGVPGAGGEAVAIRVFGKQRRGAFIASAGPSGIAGESCRLEELGGRFWLTGRVRLDARQELGQRLEGVPDTISDGLLCLHAYAKWGERFVEFLAGDFSFALWDEERQHLLAVRDQLGVRPLFHAAAGEARLLSDSLDWIARHTGADNALDDYWIADFLTLGFSREAERTVYRDIQRVFPAHVVKVADGIATQRRYWRLEVAEPLYLANRRDYSARFRELLSSAIADRLPAGRVGISMSGGLDSTALAACTLAVTGSPSRIAANCAHYAELMHIEEDYFASLAARHLGIQLRVRVVDELAYDPEWRARDIQWSEPTRSIVNAHHSRTLNLELATAADVWLEGEGPDNALRLDRDAYFSWLVGQRQWSRLATAILQYLMIKGHAGWRASWFRHTTRQKQPIAYSAPPAWLSRDLVDRLQLTERDRVLGEGSDWSHPWHPDAVASITSPIWQSFFDEYDFQQSLAPVAWRHPFLDLRVLEFMLSVPPVPWAWKKHLVREAMSGRLPVKLLTREKAPLPVHPNAILMRRHGTPELRRRGELARYVDLQALPSAQGPEFEFYRGISIHALDHWLESCAN